MARKRDQTGADHFNWQHGVLGRSMRIVIMRRHDLKQRLGDWALGSQLKLFRTIHKRRRCACRVRDRCLRPRDWAGTRRASRSSSPGCRPLAAMAKTPWLLLARPAQ